MKILKNKSGITLVEFLIAIVIVAAFFVFVFPYYIKEDVKSQVQEVFDKLETVKSRYNDYYLEKGKKPSQSEIISKDFNSDYIKEVALINDRIVILFENSDNHILNNKNIQMVAYFVADGVNKEKIIWKCDTNIDHKYLPENCNRNILEEYIYDDWKFQDDKILMINMKEEENVWEEYKSWIYDGLKSNGDIVFKYDINEGVLNTINKEGVSIQTFPENEYGAVVEKIITFPRLSGGGLLYERDAIGSANERLYQEYNEMFIGRVFSVNNNFENNNNYQRGMYGKSWSGNSAWLDLIKKANNIYDLYSNPHIYYPDQKGIRVINAYKNSLNKFKDKVSEVKVNNGGDLPRSFPLMYKYIYENY